MNRRGEYCLREQLAGLIVGTVQRASRRLWLAAAGRWLGADLSCRAQQMREVHARRPRRGARRRPRRSRPRRRARSSRCSSGARARSSGGCTSKSGIGVRDARQPAHQPSRARAARRTRRRARGPGRARRAGRAAVAHAQPVGHVSRVLGEHGAPGMETEIAIHSHGLPFEFPHEAVAEAEAYGSQRPAAMRARPRGPARAAARHDRRRGRARFRRRRLVRTHERSGWRLIVAIADVGHYVRPGTALDEEARERGTSVYFPNRVLPMLPEALSNGLCSLKPDVDRLCMCLRDARQRRRPHHALALLRGGDALGRAAHLHEVAAYPREADRATARAGSRTARPRSTALHGVYKALHARAQRARRARLRRAGAQGASSMRTGSIAALVEYHAQRRAPADRGMHDRRERRGGAFPQEAHRMPTLYRVHGEPEDRSARDAAHVPARVRHLAASCRRDHDPSTARPEPVCKHRRPAAMQRLISDGGHPLDAAGGLPAGQHRPLRPGARASTRISRRRSAATRTWWSIAASARCCAAAPPELRCVGAARCRARAGMLVPRAARRRSDAQRDVAWLKCEYMQRHARRGVRRASSPASSISACSCSSKGMQVDGLVHVSRARRRLFRARQLRASAWSARAAARSSGSATACACGSPTCRSTTARRLRARRRTAGRAATRVVTCARVDGGDADVAQRPDFARRSTPC